MVLASNKERKMSRAFRIGRTKYHITHPCGHEDDVEIQGRPSYGQEQANALAVLPCLACRNAAAKREREAKLERDSNEHVPPITLDEWCSGGPDGYPGEY